MILVYYIITLILLALMFYASYSIKSNIYLKTFCKKNTSEKVVAITFDDGPHTEQTPKVLKVLKQNNVQACFFLIGSKITNNESIVRQIIEEGHLVGNHSYSHTNAFPLYSKKRMFADLMLCQQKLEEITKETNHLFRPPFGVTNPTIGCAVRQIGMKAIGWSIRSLDTQINSTEKILKRVRKQLHPGAIILLHDFLPQSDLLLDEILKLLKEEGYSIRRLDLM